MRVLLIVVLGVLVTGCASTGATPHPFPRPGSGLPGGAGPAGSAADPSRPAGGYEISGTALSLRGSPYRDGGHDPGGFDCSGFVWYVFSQHGVTVPRTVAEQARTGERIATAELRPGDLVFFSTVSPGPSHVGIAVGGDSFVHAPSSNGVVRVERLSAPYWSSRFVSARRVL